MFGNVHLSSLTHKLPVTPLIDEPDLARGLLLRPVDGCSPLTPPPSGGAIAIPVPIVDSLTLVPAGTAGYS